MANKALDIHKAFANNLAFEDKILWDEYTPRQFPLFKQKLNELFRNGGNRDINKAMKKVRETVYKSTISQTKYTNKNLLSAFILVTVAEGTTYKQARDAKQFSAHLIVRTRKCIKNNDSSGCCMIFIDEHGRVYKNWKSFTEDNNLPKGIAFAPSWGIYTFESGKLSMESWETPASGLGKKIVTTTDIAVSAGGLAAAGVGLASLALPIAAPVMAAASAVCVGTSIYSTIRSGWQLKERSDHEQSIALTNREARGCWLSITSGAMAISSSLVNRSLAQAALAGQEVSLIRETVVNGMSVSTMLLSGTGVANGIVDILLKSSDNERISATDFLQMSASLVIFTHSVYNFRLASAIIAKAQDSSVNAYRTELKSTLREIFKKMTKLAFNGQGVSTYDKTDLIRLSNEVPDNMYSRQTGIGFIDVGINLVGICQKVRTIVELVEPLVLNGDSFLNCVQYVLKKLGEIVTVYLMEKAYELVDGFRIDIEALIRTNLYYETVLWDMYQKCAEHVWPLTLENIERNIKYIFNLLLFHYEQMSCKSSAVKTIPCTICDGFYQICPVD